MAPIQLGLIGSTGRMGTALRNYLPSQPDIVLYSELGSGGRLADFLATQPDVVVDLSLGPAVDEHSEAIARTSIPYIIGATGYQPATLEKLRAAAGEGSVLIVPNFSLGANLMLAFAARAAAFMHSPSITERHHEGKADAPSGTAAFTAERIAEARARAAVVDRPGTAMHFHEQRAGALGATVADIPVHSLRGAGYLAEQEVRFCLPGEVLSIEHRTLDRRCFMTGIVYAIRNIHRVRGLQIGLDTLLEGI